MRIAVLGAGAWGTTLADLLARKGEDVRLWAFESEVGGKVNSSHAAGPDFAFNPESASDELGAIHIDLPCRVKMPETLPILLGTGEEAV